MLWSSWKAWDGSHQKIEGFWIAIGVGILRPGFPFWVIVCPSLAYYFGPFCFCFFPEVLKQGSFIPFGRPFDIALTHSFSWQQKTNFKKALNKNSVFSPHNNQMGFRVFDPFSASKKKNDQRPTTPRCRSAPKDPSSAPGRAHRKSYLQAWSHRQAAWASKRAENGGMIRLGFSRVWRKLTERNIQAVLMFTSSLLRRPRYVQWLSWKLGKWRTFFVARVFFGGTLDL